MAEDGGVEPHPISRNLVFKASRGTNPTASSPIIVGTQGRTRTDTILLLRETPHTNWATWAFGAANRVRTGDIYLGKVVLYQLSYSRILLGAGERSRTLDLLITSELLYQLSYTGSIITYKYLHE